MSSEWKTIHLSSIATFSQGIQVPVEEQKNFRQKGYVRFVRIIDFTNPSEPLRYIKNPGKKYFVDKDDIVMIRYGSQTAGKVARGVSGFIANNMFKVNINSDVADKSYIYRFLSTEYVFNYLRGTQSSSTMPAITFGMMDSIQLKLPSKNSQIAIADFFDKLDDRIILLRETNTTLEAIAQTLFKSWFVDFDPVHAKQQGREPEGMDAETAALFPDSFEESELGLVPRGWRVGTLADITSVKGGFAYKSKDFGAEGSPVIKIKNIVGDGTVDLLDAQFIADEIAGKTKKFALKDGDIIIAMTGATIGKTGVVVTVGDKAPYLNQRVAKFEPNLKGHDNSWLVFVAFQNNFISEQVVNMAFGSAQPNISTSGIESVRLVIPSNHALLEVFNDIVTPLFSGWIANQKQAKTLTNLRDTLLPRLISGQLRLPDAEALIEETV